LLGSWMPFAGAAQLVGHFRKVTVSEATVRRVTEKSGEAYVEVQTAQVAVLEQELPPAPEGPAVQQLSVDDALVPVNPVLEIIPTTATVISGDSIEFVATGGVGAHRFSNLSLLSLFSFPQLPEATSILSRGYIPPEPLAVSLTRWRYGTRTATLLLLLSRSRQAPRHHNHCGPRR